MIERIDHINIKTARFAETVAFYEAVFDLRQMPALTMEDQEANVWLATAEGRTLIHVNTTETERPAASLSTLDHVAFAGVDLVAMRERLDRLGIEHGHMVSRVPTIEQIFLSDPNGIRIEITFVRSSED